MSRAAATIPNTAAFSEEDVERLNRMIGPATAVQRAWLAGFLVGAEQAAGAAHPPSVLAAVAATANGRDFHANTGGRRAA